MFFPPPSRSYCAPLFTSAQWPLHPGSARRGLTPHGPGGHAEIINLRGARIMIFN